MLVGALALALAGAGCSSSAARRPAHLSGSAQGLLERIERAARGAASVRVRGSIMGAAAPIKLNMELVPGRGASGEVALGGEQIDLVRLEQALYGRGNRRFLDSLVGGTAAQALGERWVRVRAYAGPLGSLSELTNLDGMIDLALSSHGTLGRPRRARLGATPALAIPDPSGHATLYAAAVGVPYPLEITRRGRRSGTLRFEGWNKAYAITPPAHSLHLERVAPPARQDAERGPWDIGPTPPARARAASHGLRGEGEGGAQVLRRR